ncbi:ion transport peptide isoform X2 [Rhodnius prolixus]
MYICRLLLKMHQERRALAGLVVASTLLSWAVAGPSSRLVLSHPLNKRSFFDLQCKGVYDKSIFARLDRICEDCYNLFREPQLHSLCRSDCFASKYFAGCLEALLLREEENKFFQMVEFLG